MQTITVTKNHYWSARLVLLEVVARKPSETVCCSDIGEQTFCPASMGTAYEMEDKKRYRANSSIVIYLPVFLRLLLF